MKVLLINGSPNEKGCTYTALMEVAAALEAAGLSPTARPEQLTLEDFCALQKAMDAAK